MLMTFEIMHEIHPIAIIDTADFTGRYLGIMDYSHHEYNDGEYDVEFSARGQMQDGTSVTVYWIFRFKVGEEPELDSLNWDKAHHVNLR